MGCWLGFFFEVGEEKKVDVFCGRVCDFDLGRKGKGKGRETKSKKEIN